MYSSRVHTKKSGNILPQSSQLAEPLCTAHAIKSGISVHELISTSQKKKKKSSSGESMVEHSHKILASEENATTTTTTTTSTLKSAER